MSTGWASWAYDFILQDRGQGSCLQVRGPVPLLQCTNPRWCEQPDRLLTKCVPLPARLLHKTPPPAHSSLPSSCFKHKLLLLCCCSAAEQWEQGSQFSKFSRTGEFSKPQAITCSAHTQKCVYMDKPVYKSDITLGVSTFLNLFRLLGRNCVHMFREHLCEFLKKYLCVPYLK